MDRRVVPAPSGLGQGKFRDPLVTARGERRAQVRLKALETLWLNTGTLCNLACGHCYIESSPTEDRLAFLTGAEAAVFYDEIAAAGLSVRTIGFTGGEPFLNPDFLAMLEDALRRGFQTLTLTNAMRPMMKCAPALLELKTRFGDALRLRVSLDHFDARAHEAERGAASWATALKGLKWLADNGFPIAVAGRAGFGEDERAMRVGFSDLFRREGVAIDAFDPERLLLFPEMDASRDVPEITEACWGILNVDPADVMCASSRMAVKRKGADRPVVVSCTLLPDDPGFEMGATLSEALGPVSLNHPHCAAFCVLGGASCSG